MKAKSIFGRIMAVMLLMSGLTSCEWVHEDISDRVTLNINTAHDDDTCGLYIVDKNNVVVKANLKITTDDTFKREFIDIEGYKHYIYTPYIENPVGMPIEKMSANAFDLYSFYKPLATESDRVLYVARGFRKCRGGNISFNFKLTEWQEDAPYLIE